VINLIFKSQNVVETNAGQWLARPNILNKTNENIITFL